MIIDSHVHVGGEIFGFDKGEHIDEPLYLRMLEEIASHKRNARSNDLKAQKRV